MEWNIGCYSDKLKTCFDLFKIIYYVWKDCIRLKDINDMKETPYSVNKLEQIRTNSNWKDENHR